jgi:two-component system cell cycle sensor histidine kinase/response regulator CckA
LSTTRNALPKRAWWQLVSSRIAIGFVVWSTLWIVVSDFVLHRILSPFSSEIWILETSKGLIYVLITAMLLYWYARMREKEYYAARRTADNRLRRLSESNLISICYWKTNGEITDANDAFLRLVGYTRKELLDNKLNWRNLTPPEYGPRDDESLQRLTQDGRHVAYEKEFIRKDQTRVPVLVGAAMLDRTNLRGIAYALDLSELKKAEQRSAELEEQLRQSQKLETVGQLASGIAHDFNNLLNIIIGYASLIEAKVAPEDPVREETKFILKAAEKATGLIRRLLAFGRKQVLHPEILDVNEMFQEYRQIIPRLIGEKIRCQFQLSPSIWQVKADRTQLEQVFVNLVVNARDAMPNGGVLTIASTNDYESGRVALRFSDNGTGMEDHVKARIFDPFFTTKSEGQGTGLGLSTVYGIVKQSKGQITVSSKPGQGTTFIVYLPRVKQVGAELHPPLPKPVPTIVPNTMQQGAETILLVEDESDLREIFSHLLRINGYHVLVADDGESAILTAKAYDQSIELLLTDVVMPNMSGFEVAQVIRRIRPGIKVIYMSGYSEEVVVDQPGEETLLEKPISTEILLRKIRESLDAKQQPRIA